MPWFIDNIVKTIKQVPEFLGNLLDNDYTAMNPASVINAAEAAPVEQKNLLEGEWNGTNYDPYDIWQNRPDATEDNLGEGAIAGLKIDENMVAVARKKDSDEAMLRTGTVIRVPELGNRLFLVADLLNERFNGQQKIDFATPKKGKEVVTDFNKAFKDIEVVRQGQGKEDARNFVNSGEWQKMLDEAKSQDAQ